MWMRLSGEHLSTIGRPWVQSLCSWVMLVIMMMLVVMVMMVMMVMTKPWLNLGLYNDSIWLACMRT